MSSNIEQTGVRIKRAGIVAIMRGDYPLDKVLAIGTVLREADIRVLEVTLNSQNALTAIRALREQWGADGLIGAGTVRTVAQVGDALGAGAQFIVSPNFDAASVAQSLAHDTLHLPGVFTATEAQAAFVAGCRMLKLFPADTVGPAYLKALRAPLNDIEFVPTGGVGVDNIAAYVRAGAVAVGVGGTLLAGPEQALGEIAERARALRAAWEAAHA